MNLFAPKTPKTPDRTAEQVLQRRQDQRISQAEGEEQREMGSRRRLLNARAQGNSATLFGSPAGVNATLGA